MGGMFDGLRVSGGGMSAQQFVLNLHAQNIANLETTNNTAGTGPYQAQSAVLQGVKLDQVALNIGSGDVLGSATEAIADVNGGVHVAGINVDKTEGPMVYQPGHPDADRNGYVHMPNVDVTTELLGLANARDVFNANETVFRAQAAMMGKGLKI